MLTLQQHSLLQQLTHSASRDQYIWLAGYFTALAGGDAASPLVQVAQAPTKPVHIYYATETGNSKAAALDLAKALKAAGIKVKNSAVNRVLPTDITTDTTAIFIISTHGEGDPPEAARAFFDHMHTAHDGTLKGVDYAILGLGDSSYELFCGAATTLNTELSRLGATALQPITLLDVDYTSHLAGWIHTLVQTLNTSSTSAALALPTIALPTMQTSYNGVGYSRLQPVQAVVRAIVNLNDHGSNKQTFHIELETEAPLHYQVGDALGVLLSGEDAHLPARLYSIASSYTAHAGQIHLTVALAKHTLEDGGIGYGKASHYLAQLQAGNTIQCYIHANHIFRLPDDATDIIMIGAGTGVAPFRAFVAERAERGASGRNWLFFGEQHAHLDFLYQAEWQEHVATDTLTRIDLAFSRDQAHKVYVQHKLHDQAQELIQWLDAGAHIYVCGAKDPMSIDVEATLITIITEQKQLTHEAATHMLAEWAEAGRYVKDVY